MDESHEKLLNLCRIRVVNVTYESASVKGEACGDTQCTVAESPAKGLGREIAGHRWSECDPSL